MRAAGGDYHPEPGARTGQRGADRVIGRPPPAHRPPAVRPYTCPYTWRAPTPAPTAVQLTTQLYY